MRAPTSPRAVAAEVVRRVLDEGAFIGPALDETLLASGLDTRDRAFATELARGTVRWISPLEESLRRAQNRPKALDKRMRPHLLVAAYQLQHLEERVPAHAAVNEAVRAVKATRPGLAGFANALLRNLGSALHQQLGDDDDDEALAAAYGVPLSLVRAVTARVATRERKEAVAGLNQRPPLGLWSVAPAETLAALRARDLDAHLHPFVPGALLVDGAGDVSSLPGFAEGHVTVMDPGSVAVALLVAPLEGAHVLDLCAAPGGKSIVLAHLVGQGVRGHGGAVVAVEQDPRRAERLEENLGRMRKRATVVVGDAASPDLALPGPPSFDAVLVDAPCSALGTTRRRPDVKLRFAERDRPALLALQAALLATAATRVAPGGVLVYAVCTPLPEEGEEQVAGFLDAHPGWQWSEALGTLPWLPPSAAQSGALSLLPHRDEADAFYAARLIAPPAARGP